MFLVRNATTDDAPTILRLAKAVHSNILPPDVELIREKILGSRHSFSDDAPRLERLFLFVLEDTETGNVVGTSAIVAAMGTPERPNVALEVRRREHWSETLQSGQGHVTVTVVQDTSGPTELGGLILSGPYRGHPAKLGSFLSLIRFHYIGMHRDWFDDRIIAEMMGALTPDSRNMLWDYLGRRFINLSYVEADRFSRRSHEFITALFPTGEIYVSLLPPEARELIGTVGPEATPAMAMLERLGFQPNDMIDPFDGGPYLEAVVDTISLVKDTIAATVGVAHEGGTSQGFVSAEREVGFRAIRTAFSDDRNGRVSLPSSAMAILGVGEGDPIGVTTYRSGEGGPVRQVESKDVAGRVE